MSDQPDYAHAACQADFDDLDLLIVERKKDQCEEGSLYWKSGERPWFKCDPADINAMVGSTAPVIDEFWTQESEQNLLQEWELSKEKSELETICPRRMVSLWTTCLHVMRCSPLAIVSPRNSLAYAPNSSVPKGKSGLVWSQGFCVDLRNLLCHPLWNGEISDLVMMLQFTVICRTNDYRPWKMKNRTGCMALQGLEMALRRNMEPLLSRSVHEMHLEERASLTRNTGKKPTPISDLMVRIGKSFQKNNGERRPGPTDDTGHIIYRLMTEDLKTLTEALDGVGNLGIPLLATVEFSYVAYMNCRNAPKGEKIPWPQVKWLYTVAWLHERREFKRELARPQQDSLMLDAPNEEIRAAGEGARNELSTAGFEPLLADQDMGIIAGDDGVGEDNGPRASPPLELQRAAHQRSSRRNLAGIRSDQASNGFSAAMTLDPSLWTFEKRNWNSRNKAANNARRSVFRRKGD